MSSSWSNYIIFGGLAKFHPVAFKKNQDGRRDVPNRSYLHIFQHEEYHGIHDFTIHFLLVEIQDGHRHVQHH